jgi:hypothetical protein
MEGNVITNLVKPLFAIRSVTGVALMDRERTLFDSIPGLNGSGDALRKLIWEFYDGYSRVGRNVTQCYFLVGTQLIFVMSAGDLKLVAAARDRKDVDEIAAVGESIANQIIPGLPLLDVAAAGRMTRRVTLLRWSECETKLKAVFSKVISSSQAERMILREFQDRQINRDQPATADQVRSFLDGLLMQIPIRSKRELIRIELEEYLQEMSA